MIHALIPALIPSLIACPPLSPHPAGDMQQAPSAGPSSSPSSDALSAASQNPDKAFVFGAGPVQLGKRPSQLMDVQVRATNQLFGGLATFFRPGRQSLETAAATGVCAGAAVSSVENDDRF